MISLQAIGVGTDDLTFGPGSENIIGNSRFRRHRQLSANGVDRDDVLRGDRRKSGHAAAYQHTDDNANGDEYALPRRNLPYVDSSHPRLDPGGTPAPGHEAIHHQQHALSSSGPSTKTGTTTVTWMANDASRRPCSALQRRPHG